MRSCTFAQKGVRSLLFSLFAVLFTTAAVAVPNAPTYLAAYAFDSTNVALLWNDNSTDETGFEIQYNTGGGWLSAGITAANQTSAGIPTPAGFSAQYQVRAVNGSGNSAFTPVVTCTQAAFNAPGSLNGLVSQENVLMTFADNATTESGFEIEARKLPSGAFTVLGSVIPNTVVVNLTGAIDPSSSYEIRVRARTGAAPSYTYTGYSNTATITTQFNPPEDLMATAVSDGTVDLSWQDKSAIEGGYAVYFKPSTSGSYVLYDYTAADANTFTVTGLSPGTTYNFQVAAAYQSADTTIIESTRSSASATTKDGFTSRTYQPITLNQAFTYQAVVSTGSARTSWNITGLPTGLTFNSTSGVVSGTPTVAGVFVCPMTATFANGWTTNSSLTLRVIRAPGAPITATTFAAQTLSAGGNTSVALPGKFSDPDAESAVRVVTNLGTMDFILYNTATPQTVTNFLSYVNAPVNNYNSAVFHRSVSGFVVQGGGFKVQSAPNNFTAIPTTASPINEPGISNLRGTVAMAKVGSDPNSATNQFFVNLGNNSSNLDNQNGGFTVFARVAGNGMTVADAMAALPTVSDTVNVNGTPNAALTDWPLTSASASMDTTKVVSITSAAPVPVLSYSVTGNTDASVATAAINGTDVQIDALSGGQTDVTVTATDLDGNTVAQTFTVTVNETPVFTNGPPPSPALVGSSYSFAYTASGYPAPTFSHTGSLPPGLTLSSAGVLSGTPTTAGTYSGIVITASNGIGTAPTQPISITVNQVPEITSGAAPAGILGVAYSHSFTATGSPAPTFSTSDTLPTGLTLSTAGVLSGTPSATGTFSGTVTATNVAGTSDQAFSIVINEVPAFTNGPPPNSGTVGTAYNFSFTASGTPVPTFAVTAGALPAGLSLSTAGVISGTPTTAGGPFTGTVTASNGIGTPATQDFSITIHQVPVITSSAAPAGVLGVAYSHSFTATGSPAPTFAVTAGTLPGGLSLSPAGVLSGTPTATGTFSGTVTATNVAGTSDQAFSIVINEVPAFTNGPPPNSGTVGTAYNFSFTASGTPAPTFQVTAGALPAGLSLSTAGVISGTPTTAGGPFTGTVTASNGIGTPATQDFSITIAKGTAVITLGGLSQTYDGTPKSITAGSTPGGLTIDVTYGGSATTPTAHGSYAVSAVVNDDNWQGSASDTLVISGQSLASWRTQYFTAQEILDGLADDDADPDGDGQKNLAEYALGTNPRVRDAAPAPVVDANGLTLIFTRPKDLPGVDYAAESTDNLSGWNPVTLEVIGDGPVQTVRARDPLSSGNPSRRMMRLIFSPTP